MKKELIGIFICVLFIGSVLPVNGNVTVENYLISLNNGNILYVGGVGPGNYTYIQDAINETVDGDTVFVYNDSSPFKELLVVDKSINLIGEDRNTTVIVGRIYRDVIYIKADRVNISGFTIQNGHVGIYLINSNSSTITDNIICSNNEYGIHLYKTNNNIIKGNHIILNEGYGIYNHHSSNNTIFCNKVSNNKWGIELYVTTSNKVINNTISNNINQGILLYSSSRNNDISGNTISNNYEGIRLGYSNENNSIIGNIISNNYYGIFIYQDSISNTIYHNNFINSGENAQDEGNNIWDDGEYGNFWIDYRLKYPFARKIRIKGIWNTPYEISEGINKDMYPLINQWPNPRTRTISMDTTPSNSFWMQFLGMFPVLQRILRLLI